MDEHQSLGDAIRAELKNDNELAKDVANALFLSELGQEFRKHRLAANKTKKRLAKQAKVKRVTIKNLEWGNGEKIPVRKLYRIANSLGFFLQINLVTETPLDKMEQK